MPERICTRPQSEFKKHDQRLQDQTQKYLGDFYLKLARKNAREIKVSPQDIQEACHETVSIIKRDNKVNRILHGNEFQPVLEREAELSGNVKMGLLGCVDDRRFPHITTPIVSKWQGPAGAAEVKKRPSDDLLIPRSPILQQGIFEVVQNPNGFIEFIEIHSQSSSRENGCAAATIIRGQIESGKSPLLSQTGMARELITGLDYENLADFNLYLSEVITAQAFNNYYNSCLEILNRKAVPRVAVPVHYYTDTMGSVIRKLGNPNQISSTDLAMRFKDFILQRPKSGYFGEWRYQFNSTDHILEFAGRKVEYTAAIIEQYQGEIEEQLHELYPELLQGQIKATVFYIANNAAFQYMTGFALNTNHEYSNHRPEYMSVSTAEAVGQRDPRPKVISSASNPEAALENLSIKLLVMDRHHKNPSAPKILFVCHSIDRRDFETRNKGYMRSMQMVSELYNKIIENEEYCDLVKKGKLAIVPALVCDTDREILEIPNLARIL
ncbi:hypothetical protein HY382_02295 [Candidatus Curtissbacteria bacterium]|nr:hypothetical protein [Candidatus Curtissbacteria bacterium]